jgi:hypothetical protein
MHTRLMGPSHRVVGRAVNCPLPGPPGLRSSLGGEAASTWESSLAVLYVYAIHLNCFPAVGLYSVYIVYYAVCTLYIVRFVHCI